MNTTSRQRACGLSLLGGYGAKPGGPLGLVVVSRQHAAALNGITCMPANQEPRVVEVPSAAFVPAASEDEWRALRAKGVGGSDVAAILGVSPWTSTYALWCEKTGRCSRDIDTAATRWGKRLEPVIAEAFASETTDEVVALPNGLYRSTGRPYALATPDRVLCRDGVAVGVLEIKTANARNATDWRDGPPVHYLAQVAWYQWVTGLREGRLAVLIGGQDFRIFDLPFEDTLGDVFADAADAFWHLVETDEAPPVDGHPATTAALRERFARSEPHAVPLDALENRIAQRAELLKRREALDAEIAAIDNAVREALGDAEVGTIAGEVVVTWRDVVTTRIDSTRLRREHPEIAEKVTTSSHSRRFCWHD